MMKQSDAIFLAMNEMLWWALATTEDSDGQPLGDTFAAEEISPAAVERLTREFTTFWEQNSDDIAASEIHPCHVGREFWRTRSGQSDADSFIHHGTRDELSGRLMFACWDFPDIDLVIGSDGLPTIKVFVPPTS